MDSSLARAYGRLPIGGRFSGGGLHSLSAGRVTEAQDHVNHLEEPALVWVDGLTFSRMGRSSNGRVSYPARESGTTISEFPSSSPRTPSANRGPRTRSRRCCAA